MLNKDNALAASAGVIVIFSAVNIAPRGKSHHCRFWVRPSLLHGRKRYGITDFMEDLILNNQNLLILEYHSGGRFSNFFGCPLPCLKKYLI